jgi:hypothetical protein
MINRDVERYATLLRLVASLSRLFSDNDAPYVDSRFVERLFVQTTGAVDLGRKDISFDARIQDIGIGVKTFLGGVGNSKREKIAEFTAYARDGRFNGLSKKDLVHEVVQARNDRVISDANEIGIDIEKSIYHCLIRIPGGAIVHEEPYGTIIDDAIRPTNSYGEVVGNWDDMGNGIYFTDGISHYSYSTAKNVLMKQFIFDRGKEFVPIEILSDPLAGLEEKFEVGSSTQFFERVPSVTLVGGSSASMFGDIEYDELRAGTDYIVLPLYRSNGGQKEVPLKSGINQWNAAGRRRKFGEAYIPIPSQIHSLFPDFLPPREVTFDLYLPNRKEPVVAKVCQDGGKALMTNPNHLLGEWLIGVLKPTVSRSRFAEFVTDTIPISYEDLLRIEKDSVRLVRLSNGDKFRYSAEFSRVDAYEDFLTIS